MGTSIFSFVIVLGVLITFHELGHFLVARFFKVGVEAFSVGFGPKIFGKKIGMTQYQLAAIPLGGYVKMVGEAPDVSVDPEQIPISFTHQHVLKRMAIVAAGPMFNFILAIAILFGIYTIKGVPEITYVDTPLVGAVSEGGAAEKAGLQKGDLIVEIDGVSVPTWDSMSEMISASEGKELPIVVERENNRSNFNVIPDLKPEKNIYGDETKKNRYFIGVERAVIKEYKEVSVVRAMGESIRHTGRVTVFIVDMFGQVIRGKLSMKIFGGPITIAKVSGERAREGVESLFFFIAMISINLAVLNLLPIPVLDGGHLLFFSIEAITGRPVSMKVREIAQQIGVFLLIALMIFVFYIDITRFF